MSPLSPTPLVATLRRHGPLSPSIPRFIGNDRALMACAAHTNVNVYPGLVRDLSAHTIIIMPLLYIAYVCCVCIRIMMCVYPMGHTIRPMDACSCLLFPHPPPFCSTTTKLTLNRPRIGMTNKSQKVYLCVLSLVCCMHVERQKGVRHKKKGRGGGG